jgi:hypothetical protein
MALRIYFIEQDRLAAAFAPRRGGLWSIISSRTLLEWVERELRKARMEAERMGKGYTSEIPSIVDEVLLWNPEWKSSAPGVEFVVEIKLWGAMEDLGKISAKLPEPLAHRFRVGADGGGADFPPDLPADSPIRVLDLPGWQFFHRKDIETLEAAYESTEKSVYYVEDDGRTLFIEEDDEQNVWNLLFEKHRSRKNYDFALFWHEGYL